MNNAFFPSLVLTGLMLGLTSLAPADPPTVPDSRSDVRVDARGVPPDVLWAQRLVAEVPHDRNEYNWSPTYVVWTEDNNGPARNRSVCSSFVTHVLERAYGIDVDQIAARFGLKNPQAKDYYTTVVAERGFKRIRRVDDMRPGDIIAVRYPEGSHPTGHVMIFASAPERQTAEKPIERGTEQYVADVFDSSHSFHGFSDSRYVEAGKKGHGVGRGPLRLYVRGGEIVGYTWSTRKISKYFPESEHEVAVGRFDPAPVTASASPLPESENGDNSEDSHE
jgi:hypothetical protein